MSVMYPELFEHFENCAQGNLVLSQRMKKVVCFKMFAVKNTHVAFSDQGIEIRVKLMRKYDYIWEVRGKVELAIKLALSSQKDVYVVENSACPLASTRMLIRISRRPQLTKAIATSTICHSLPFRNSNGNCFSKGSWDKLLLVLKGLDSKCWTTRHSFFEPKFEARFVV